MSLPMQKRQEIRRFILKAIDNNISDIPASVVEHFGVSRQTAYNYSKALAEDGLITVEQTGKKRHYLLNQTETSFKLRLEGLEEDVVWKDKILPLLPGLPKNVLSACNYGFTEILNNAIEHSESIDVLIVVEENALRIKFIILDAGVGIFKKIQKAFNLEDPRHAILELAKGKLTTDPKRHTGEGIFFTSRIFDDFYISSGKLRFLSGRDGELGDYLSENKDDLEGTSVMMSIEKDSDVQVKEVFELYTATNDGSFGFTKTHIPVRLAEHEGELLVSRSQAKRLTRRFDRFVEVILDFEGVSEIGQAFADELFRVFANDHPDVELIPVNMSEDVRKMVSRARSSK